MRDLALPTLATSATLLAVYAAGLIFVAQHVADRYTPLLYPIVAIRIGLAWLGLLSFVVLASLAFTFTKVTTWANIVEALLLVSALALTVIGLYRTFRGAADRDRILGMISHLRDKDRTTALRDLTWNSVNRGDVTSTEYLLNLPSYGSQEQAELIDWITQYSQLLEQPWLRQAILVNVKSGVFDDIAAKLLRPAIGRLIIHCLDKEWYDFIHEVILELIWLIERSQTFTEYHRCLIFDIGFNLHYVGEEGRAATPRISVRAPKFLQDTRDLYISKLTALRWIVLGHADPSSLTQFCTLLERLAESGIGIMYVSSQVWEILEDGYKHGLLEQRTLESLANMIGFCRNSDEDYPDFIDPESELDMKAAHLALYIVALGYEDQLGRMMGNARLGHPKRMPRRLAMHNSLGEETYSAVAKILGYKSWPKK